MMMFGEVKYRDEDHKALLMPTYKKIEEHIENGALLKKGRESLLTDSRLDKEIEAKDKEIDIQLEKFIFTSGMGVGLNLFFLKLKAFEEEKESRLVKVMFESDQNKCLYRVN